jgi:hypothetical protein
MIDHKMKESQEAQAKIELKRQESLLELIGHQMESNVKKLLGTAVKNEIKNSVLPAISQIVSDQVSDQVSRGVGEALRKVCQSFKCRILLTYSSLSNRLFQTKSKDSYFDLTFLRQCLNNSHRRSLH